MKKIVMLLGILSMVSVVSCKDKEPVAPPPGEPVIEETTTVVVPVDTTKQDGTSIKVGSDGLDVSTKDGKRKTDVNISKDDASIEVKK